MITYVDTSILIKVLIEEPGSAAAAEIWDNSEVIVAASIGYAEARAALAAASRAGRLTARQARNARTSLDQLWSQLLIVEVTVTVVERAGDIAEAERLRGYDAVHASAAIEIGADVIATADADLARAADHLGFHLAGCDEN